MPVTANLLEVSMITNRFATTGIKCLRKPVTGHKISGNIDIIMLLYLLLYLLPN